jgi:hypothetical protein
MALSTSLAKKYFSTSYQTIYQKASVAKDIANFRFESNLTAGQTVQRQILDFTGVRVRTITRGSDRTIDTLADSEETLTINYAKGTSFQMPKWDKVQAGALNPMQKAGMVVARKLALDFDAYVLSEARNGFVDFDNGSLTTMSPSGTPITLSSTTVPQMVARAVAFVGRNIHETSPSDMVWVIDNIAASDMTQYLMGKNVDAAVIAFQNGRLGTHVGGAQIYISENLTGEWKLTFSGQPTAAQTIIINGVTFTAVAVIGAVAGNFLIGASASATATNLYGLLNAPATTSATQVALSAANQAALADSWRLTVVDSTAGVLTGTGIGSGRFVFVNTLANVAITYNMLHSYLGKKGAIDAVVQDQVDMEIREEAKQRTENVLADILGGYKTFADGAAQFVDLLIAV